MIVYDGRPHRSNKYDASLYLCRSLNADDMSSLMVLAGFVGPWQIALIVVVVLLLFGGRKIPELMRGLGSGIKEFKEATKEDDKDDSKEIKD